VTWPPPCPECGADIKQQIEFNADAQNFKQRCHVCGFEGEWEPYPPARAEGYTFTQVTKALGVRHEVLLDARKRLVLARRLSLHSPATRDEIGRLVEGVDECLARWTPPI
jgi:hypothetical protein